MPRFVPILVGLLAAMLSCASASAQTFPSKTVKFIVPFGPGSGADLVTRIVSERLQTRWGKPVIVENRPGAEGMIAINAFLSDNDPHTIIYLPVAMSAAHPYTQSKLTYDADRDLMPISSSTSLILCVASPASLKATTMREFVDMVRAEPGKYNVAAAQGSTEFLMSGFLKSRDLQVAKIPYKDILQAPRDLAEGQIQMLMASVAIVQPLVQAGKVRIMAVASPTRASTNPDVPTVKEAGFPELELESLTGFFGSNNMPVDTRQRIAADIKAVLDGDATIKERLAATGQTVNVHGPAEFSAGIRDMRSQLKGIADILGLKAVDR